MRQQKIRAAVASHVFDYESTKLPVTISIGVAEMCEEAATPTALIKAADKALYAAKAGGRNRVVLQ